MKFDSNAERRAYWQAVHDTYPPEKIAEALQRMPPACARVLQLHYYHKHSLKEITAIINRSSTTVQNYHNRGIVRLYLYFNPGYWKKDRMP
jgi:DNA-directed RNA polymerase specialized sigma24 family protein